MQTWRKFPRVLMAITLSLALFMGAGFSPVAAQNGGPPTDGNDDSGVGPGYLPENRTLLAANIAGTLSGPAAGSPRSIALGFVADHLQALGLTKADMGEFVVTDQYTDEYNGVTHIYFAQRIHGIDVKGATLSINIARDGSVINLSSSFIHDLGTVANGRQVLSAQQAVQAAARQIGSSNRGGLQVIQERGGPQNEILFAGDGLSLTPIPARLVYQPVASDDARLAWQVEIYPLDARHWWNLRVDSESGAVLAQEDYVDDTGTQAGQYGGVVSTRLVSLPQIPAVTDNASYRVFALPIESPSDGNRSNVVKPADPVASPFGWHDINGRAGAEFTVTRGNNVYAYTDLDADNRADPGSAPDGGKALNFDFPLDLTQTPDTYRPAAVTNLFYWNNIVHDVLVGYGFTEAAGNFQVKNYSNQGKGKDSVQAEAQDGSGTDNANFATPPDGQEPRMQMYVWNYPFPITIHVTAPSTVAGDYNASEAVFGPSLSAVGPLSGTAVVVNDGSGASPTDACEPLTGFPAGSIAIIDRGTCTFVSKVKNAQNAGAIAVIMVNNVAGDPITMGGTDSTISIPAVMVARDVGTSFKANAPITVTMEYKSLVPARDSDLDSGVITHEYGHGVSNRLTGGPMNVSCLNNAEQMGEGWSDFLALAFTAVPGDKSDTPRGVGTYVVFQDPSGVGIRPTPYTTDMSVNPATYSSILANGEVHFTGYVWASMLWEVYWNLVSAHGYNPNLYANWQTGGNNLAMQLVMDGMKLQTCHPGFVDGRNAILQADQVLTGGANQCDIWRGFAKRGLGFSADQGNSNSTTDGREAFDLPTGCTP